MIVENILELKRLIQSIDEWRVPQWHWEVNRKSIHYQTDWYRLSRRKFATFGVTGMPLSTSTISIEFEAPR